MKTFKQFVTTFKQYLTEAKSYNNLPPVFKTSREVLNEYGEIVQRWMDDMLKRWGSSLKDDYKNNLTIEKYCEELMPTIFPQSIDYNDETILNIALENKDKIFNRIKRNKHPKDELNFLFWNEFRDFYSSYKDKLEREENKKKEAEEKERRTQARLEKQNARKSFQMIKDVFDKSSKDLVWKSLLKLKEKNKEHFENIKREYESLKENNAYYLEYLENNDERYAKRFRNKFPAKDLYLHKTKGYAFEDIQISKLDKTRLEKLLQDDIELKYADLIRRVVGKIGTHIEKVDLKSSANGSVNGTILSDAGRVSIDTILAWGDINRPHYRVLVR